MIVVINKDFVCSIFHLWYVCSSIIHFMNSLRSFNIRPLHPVDSASIDQIPTCISAVANYGFQVHSTLCRMNTLQNPATLFHLPSSMSPNFEFYTALLAPGICQTFSPELPLF